MAEATSLAALVGEQVRTRREELSLTQDELARRIGWARAAVAKIERGARDALTLDEVLMLSLTLEVTPAALVGEGKRYVRVGPISLRAQDVAAGLRGEASWVNVGASRSFHRTVKSTEQGGEADQKAATRLGLDLTELGVLTHHLWGRSLTDERDRRLVEQERPDDSARTVQARRGHVTRALLDEMRQALEKGTR